MNFIEVTTKDGAVIEFPDNQICFVFRKPMEPVYSLASPGAMTGVDSVATPFDRLVEKLGDQFVPFEIPEGTTAYVNQNHVMFITSPQLGIVIMMFLGGIKLVVKEGLTEVRKKLGGGPTIQLHDP